MRAPARAAEEAAMDDDLSFRRPKGAPPYVFGHRGVRGEAPENTMAAFELAAAAGADGIELDVRICRSGELVVCHDADLARLTDGRDIRKIADLDGGELARVDVGGGQRVPLLTEVLTWAERRRLRVNVEMKRDVPDRRAVVQETARLLAGAPLPPVIVSSFDPWMLAYLSWRRPSLLLAYLFASDHKLTRSGWAARVIHVGAMHPERTEIDGARLRAWHKRGHIVNVWTVNEAAEARALAAMGVDGIITDVPRRIGEVVRRC
jgi:glycerophosphoryl diester phosphodiesterase